ncbi:hypothetical protein EDC47_101521 [Raoultella planticola]|jgi:hypothetical protein|nr:hypothetical protein EDC47_101521 [Raoultella planticola]
MPHDNHETLPLSFVSFRDTSLPALIAIPAVKYPTEGRTGLKKGPAISP